MPSNLSTKKRMYFVTLHDYGEDEVLIDEMSGREGMSQLFEFQLRLLSQRDDIDARKIIAKPAILRIETWDSRHMGGERHWNGYVSRFKRTGRERSAEGHDLYAYECDIVPWLWFMTQHEDCRIFQNKTARDIIEAIFGEFEYKDFRFELAHEPPMLEYCTQYHETTFAFISRLIEREGIHYYFRHNEEGGESRHILVFTDHNGANPKLDPATIPFHHDGAAEAFDAIRALSLDQQMRTRKVTLADWDFSKKRLVRENTPTVLEIGEDRDLERYRYPGGFVDPDLGRSRSRVVMEAEEANHLRLQGDSQVRTLAPGHVFALEDHPFDDWNMDYTVLTVEHHGRNNLVESGAASDYGNTFTIQPHAITWRAPLLTPKARVHGPQTALVTGPQGEEIHTDKYGRIKIQLHWDREGEYDDKSSCWVRVAQAWAGNGYGTMFIPRVGMEVVVAFLEGDPDQPIVTGCVYNGVNMPPYALPGGATRSTIKTLSSKGGSGTNELRFEDRAGSEEVFLQAQKELKLLVKDASTVEIQGNARQLVGGATVSEYKGRMDINAHADWSHAVEASYSLASKGFLYLGSARDNAKLAAMGSVSLHSQTDVVQMSGPQGVIAESTMMVSLKCGSSSVVLSPAGVQITGPMVMINSGGSPRSYVNQGGDMALASAAAVEATRDGKVTDPTQQLQAEALVNAARQGQPFCAECKAARAAYEALMA